MCVFFKIYFYIYKLKVILVFQIIRFHAGSLPAYIVSNILLTYGGQLSTLISTGSFLEIFFSVTSVFREITYAIYC